ncbi:hypothetical protein F4803DRAFT_253506 [Xylaria telfairii]|nr:hypothetical protein F4803DRAFT_253506 [Xylaria telfairii]
MSLPIITWDNVHTLVYCSPRRYKLRGVSMFVYMRRNAQYLKLDSGINESRTQSRSWLLVASVSLLSVSSFVAGWMLGGADRQPSVFLDTIPLVPVTGVSRQQVMTLPEMQAAPPANGSHEPAWDQLIPNGLGYIRHPTLAPNVSVIGIFHQLHCLVGSPAGVISVGAKSVY